ncbi:glycoside hydrolase superfamily [Globomyces pollinis-pini]|nr:glycoside hydrolase superfamily [Globomyces pollinis-pini]
MKVNRRSIPSIVPCLIFITTLFLILYHAIPVDSHLHPTFSKPNFVTIKNTQFIVNGQDQFQFSANYWQAMNLATYNKTRFLLELDQMQRIGIQNIRIMASSEGPNYSAFRVDQTLMGNPGVYDQELLKGLDLVMVELAKRKMKAVLCLNNFWQWSGGFAQYVNWITNEPIPYPRSWNKTLGNWTTGDNDVFESYASRFYLDQSIYNQTQTIFRKHIESIINRKNTITGRLYKNDDTIFSWELANEPQSPPRHWIDDTCSYIKQLDQNHLVTVGLESKNDETEFFNIHQSSFVDYATIHIWVQNRGEYDMMDPSDGNIKHAIDWGLQWIEKSNQWAIKLNKPLILEEFGFPRDNWNGKSVDEIYSPLNPVTRKNRYYLALLTRLVQLRNLSGGYAGFGFWTYSGNARPGDSLIGDPPHEPAGWYSVYDMDRSTIKVMQTAFKLAT